MTNLNHPNCNLIFGERLYYLLINVKSDLFGVQDHLVTSLRKAGLDSTSCAYFIFGESDILLRVWASEAQLNTFERVLKDFGNDVEAKAYLVINQDTWYQREIEKRPDWSSSFSPENVQSALQKGELPEVVRFCLDNPITPGTTKFFVIVEEPLAKAGDELKKIRAILPGQKIRAVGHLHYGAPWVDFFMQNGVDSVWGCCYEQTGSVRWAWTQMEDCRWKMALIFVVQRNERIALRIGENPQ